MLDAFSKVLSIYSPVTTVVIAILVLVAIGGWWTNRAG